ncbi:G2/mitotic-specific cyclin-A-like [Convolutriloba macropyga]|uniref:G2/mitotic-specific cyclin-A-like n=1 Tax=Convolutriloba macropyga TaxID=536237 RepID=UPI003F51D4EB
MDVENMVPSGIQANGKANTAMAVNNQRQVLGNVANHGGIQKRKGLKERNAAGEADHRAAKKDIARTPTNQNDENMDVDSLENMETEQELEVLLPPLEIAFREPEYCADGYRFWQATERKLLPVPKYMRRQKEIDWEMRSTLVDWLVEVGEEFKLCNETLFLSVAYVDRFLSIMSCTRDKLQLAGVAAMFIAAKYEEIYPPTALEFVNLTDNTYNTRQLLKLEKSMLKALKFQLSQPSAHAFLNHLIKSYDQLFRMSDPESLLQLENLSKFICELTLLQGDPFLSFLPSQIAASSLYVAAASLKMQSWVDGVATKSGYSLNQLEACIRYTHKLYTIVPRLNYTAIVEKYKDERFGEVGELVAPRSIPLILD